MTILAFVIWTLGWPTACQWQLAYSKKCGIEYTENVRGFSALIDVLIWFFVAVALWRKI